uniref:Uncharacterized protein n=1 Tax=Branchiostoma floridae TaxID=7739 RepID=C3ZZ25_BRAFL|eukprot:XP_002586216.1 hypothetical protein BRAFLDRAFT_109574 [Branchiostoma floridae]
MTAAVCLSPLLRAHEASVNRRNDCSCMPLSTAESPCAAPLLHASLMQPRQFQSRGLEILLSSTRQKFNHGLAAVVTLVALLFMMREMASMRDQQATFMKDVQDQLQGLMQWKQEQGLRVSKEDF